MNESQYFRSPPSIGSASFDSCNRPPISNTHAHNVGEARQCGPLKKNYSCSVDLKMASVGGGLGMGVRDYNAVFVFEKEKALAPFLDSRSSGSGQGDAAASRVS
jgi:hypothetical protein